jgi:thiol-disulfide isomerase/thioredoxin
MRHAFAVVYLLSTMMLFYPSSVQADGPPLNGEMSRFNFSDSQQSLSQISFTDASDNQISLAAYRGKIVVLNLWATWCGPCLMEMPALDHLQAAFSPNDLVVIPVSIDRGGPHQAAPYISHMNIHAMTPYFDKSNSIGRQLNASRIPMTVVIGRDGNEIGRFVGTAEWDSSEAKSLMKYFIASGGDQMTARFVKSDVSISR